MPRRHELTDEQFERLKRMLPPNGRRGGQWVDHRTIFNGMLWRLCTGAPWRDVPERYGPWQTVYDRFNRWSRDGTLVTLAQALLVELDGAGRIDWDLWNIDGSSIRASRAAGGAAKNPLKKGKTSRPTMPWDTPGAASAASCT